MNNNFCPWPFSHLSITSNSRLKACCVAKPFNISIHEIDDLKQWWKTYTPYQELRQHFIDDKQHPMCNTCWKQESVGFTSMRNRLNTNPTNTVDFDNFYIKDVEITGGRLCNLNCRMCGSHSSNQIEKEKRPWEPTYQLHEKINWLDDPIEQEKILKLLSLPTVKNIYFTGGEPQLMPCYQELLEKLSSIRNLNEMTVHFNTNATVFNEDFWKLIKLFKKRQIDLSIDSTDSGYETIRYGNTTWNKTRENVFRIRDYLAEPTNITELHICTTGQLANLDAGTALQNLMNEVKTIPNVNYYFILLPVVGYPEWEWQNIPKEILVNELEALGDKTGKIIFEYRAVLKNAINNNSFDKKYIEPLFAKEEYFKNKFGVCIWDRRPDWFKIYQDLA